MGARSRCSQWISLSQIRDLAKKWIRYRSIKSTSYGHGSLVCGLWLAGGGRGGSVPTYVLGTFYIRFFGYQGYKSRKNCKPSCRQKATLQATRVIHACRKESLFFLQTNWTILVRITLVVWMGLRWDEWSDGKYVPANLSVLNSL
jgi:hypothetical protein